MPLKPRLALARPAEHPLSRAVAEAGWEPVHVPITRIAASGAPPPQPLHSYQAVVLLSPNTAWALRPWIEEGQPATYLVQGEGTREALAGAPGEVLVASSATAEGVWELLRTRYPDGGSFLLARAERSRGYLEEASLGSPWRLWPWITHREEAADPPPRLPDVEAVLALSPAQAEILGGLAPEVLRFGWGARCAFGFRRAGVEATDVCEPRLDALQDMLRRHLRDAKV